MSKPSPVTKLSSIALLVAMVAPALSALVPAATASNDPVPFVQGVHYSDLTNINTALYFQDSPVPPSVDTGPTPPAPSTGGIFHIMTTLPPRQSTQTGGAGDTGTKDTFGLQNPGLPVGPEQTAEFGSGQLLFPINVSGDNALVVTWSGQWPDTTAADQMRWTVTVKADTTQIGSTNLIDGEAAASGCSSGANPGAGGQAPGDKYFTCPVKLDRHWGGTYGLHAKQRIVVAINATFVPLTGPLGGLPANPPTSWTLDAYDPANPTLLEIRTLDGVKAATWTEDISGHAQALFRPQTSADLKGSNKIWGYLAVKSAFGQDDIQHVDLTNDPKHVRNFDPKLHVLRNGTTPYPLPPANLTEVSLVADATNSSPLDGSRIYRMDAGQLWSYTYSPTGEYTLEGAATLRPDDAARQVYSIRVTWKFVISAQSLDIVPFDDPTTASLTHPLESTSHNIAPGGTTTFLLLVRNLGDANDTVTLTPSLVSSQPTFGWSARLGGPDLIGSQQTHIGPHNSSLVTLTFSAPAQATNDESAIFSLVASSGIDASVKSKAINLIATVSPNVTPAAGLLVRQANLDIRPGIDKLVTVYAWNRGNRPANVTIHLNETPLEHWNTSILQGSVEGRAATVSSVPAGDLAPVTVKVRVDTGVTAGTQHNLTLFANQVPAIGATMAHDLVFTVRSVAAFQVRILTGIRSDTHYLEMTCGGDPKERETPPGSQISPTVGCTTQNPPLDYLEGTFFRVWVTNNGDQTDTFDLSIPANQISEDKPNEPISLRSAAWPATPNTDDFALGIRAPNGHFTPSKVPFLSLGPVRPGQTGEAYVWVHHMNDTSVHFPDAFSFVVDAKSESSGLHQAAEAQAVGTDSQAGGNIPHTSGVLLEPVERRPEYFSSSIQPIVDLRYVNLPVVRKAIDLSGTPQYFFARVTNGADWFTYTDPSTNQHFDDSVNLTLSIADPTHSWNVTMRPRTGELDARKNPWLHTITFNNLIPVGGRAGAGRVGFDDEEIEIKVIPPAANSTHHLLAGDSLTFFLKADQSDGGGAHGAGQDSLTFEAVVARLANVSIYTGEKTEPVHAGQQTAFAVTIANNASANASVHFSAHVEQAGGEANLWGVTPSAQEISMAAGENRTLALIVSAPASATPGQTAVINATVQYRRDPSDPNSELVNRTLDLVAEVKELGKLRLTSAESAKTIAPGARVSFKLTLENLDTTKSVAFQRSFTKLDNWSQDVSPAVGALSPGGSTDLLYVLTAPTDVVRDRSYATVIKVEEPGAQNQNNFDIVALTVNIIGGHARPSLQAITASATVDRDGLVKYAVGVKNLGNYFGNFPLSATTDQPGWIAGIETTANQTPSCPGVKGPCIGVAPLTRLALNLTVRAPHVVPEGTVTHISLRAQDDPVSPSMEDEITVKTAIHDYGLAVQTIPSRVDLSPGIGKDFVARLTNLGNDNDTMNLSVDFQGLTGWSADFGSGDVRLLPGQATDVHFALRSPLAPLPTPHDYTLNVLASSLGGAAVGLPKNASSPLVATILNYRSFDVDGDGQIELAIDANKRASDGFEQFAEIHSEGVQTRLVAALSGRGDGRTDFLLEAPTSGSYTGVANLYFDPDQLFVYKIEFTPDYTGDSTPDYLIDTDNDGTVDHAFDAVTSNLATVTVIHAFGGTKTQYLIDTNLDGRPDKYYDPEKNLVTKTIPAPDKGPNVLGLDTVGDGKPHKYYDIQTGQITNAGVTNLLDFAKHYWYFFALFVVVVVLAAVVISRRRKA